MTTVPADWSEAERHLASVDPKLAALMERVGPCTMGRPGLSIFYSLARSIVYQQLAGAAAAAIMARVDALFGEGPCAVEHIAEAGEEQLRSAGLSKAKMLALKDLAAKTLDGTVPTEEEMCSMSDDEIIERVTKVRGIGRWTAEMMLMFRLCRPNVLPTDDYGVRKGFQLLYRMRALPTKEQMLKRGKTWDPWRSVGSWYMWRVLELPENQKRRTARKKAAKKTAAKKSTKKTKARATKPRTRATRTQANKKRRSAKS
ncbi:MAG TPA: DNA-3-methyladenine glycosylase 2 family protein [Terriglobales bacterium]